MYQAGRPSDRKNGRGGRGASGSCLGGGAQEYEKKGYSLRPLGKYPRALLVLQIKQRRTNEEMIRRMEDN
jgi:hypothetical protein